MKYLRYIVYCILIFPAACNNEPQTGPVKINFDRDSCERCRMLISDRYHATQIRGGDNHKVYKFDDIGGAVIWLEQQAWKDNIKTEIWVTNHETGDWVNAREAWYVREKHTPMNYGFSAEPEERTEAIDYTAMVKAVLEKEDKQRSR